MPPPRAARTVRGMLRRLPAAAAIACLGVAVAAAPAPAKAKKPKIRTAATYKVTFHAAMKESWKYTEDYADDCELTGAMCTRIVRGDGSAAVFIDTRGPQTCMNVRGPAGRPPSLCLGSGQPSVAGTYQRQGALVTTYDGPWDAANPDVTAPTSGCGRTSFRGEVGIAWRGRHAVYPSLVVSDPHDDCPDGPPQGMTWKGGESPSLMDVEADAAPGKFLGTKQFTVSGSRTWTGTWGPFNRADGLYRYGGEKTVTWQWSATFRLKKGRR
jgi:hypothetical protein